jgi:hypothetical protein
LRLLCERRLKFRPTPEQVLKPPLLGDQEIPPALIPHTPEDAGNHHAGSNEALKAARLEIAMGDKSASESRQDVAADQCQDGLGVHVFVSRKI